MKCPECGADNPNDAVFCKRCGTKFVNNTYNVTIEEPKYNGNANTGGSSTASGDSGSNAAAYVACCCFAIIILYVIGMFL